ncbi:MAG: YggS family pyridoxal phosphate-dependent enzyme [Lachnospiraceae bacterium]|nr:YggS family pyridoxal phosphate-dependent enzyme [Lachnospiraceae bacterium]
MTDIEYNLSVIEDRIAAACARAGRAREEVTLIAVSKTKPVSAIEDAIRCGIREFGENKVQELTDKYDQVTVPVNWHLIGHLQRNKVKYIIGKTRLIHSVDSVRLAAQIEEEAAKKDCICDILIELNIAGEESKFGVTSEELEAMIREIAAFPHIRIKGLMTVAPFVENPEENRPCFCKMRELFLDIKSKNIDNVSMETLSMGMSKDFETAIEEGATMVRIGTSIFGERIYPQKN